MENQTIMPTIPAQQRKGYVNYIQAFLFVGIYVTLGYVLKLDPNIYLLIGIPLTVAFQLFVRRLPIYRLWVRDSPRFKLSKLAIVIAIAFMAEPVRELVLMLIHKNTQLVKLTFLMTAMIGAIGAAFSFCSFTKATVKQFFLCLLIAGGIGIFLILLGPLAVALLKGHSMHFGFHKGIKSLLIYIPVGFVMEEVIFRGMLDTLVNPGANPKNIGSAFFVSALWGLWHLPVAHANAVVLIVVHSLVGIPLSIFWRKSGNLAVTSFTHAFIDAVRNALM